MVLFSLSGQIFQIPLKDMLINEFIDKSIGYIPKDIIRDGLPHFGSKRDDWLGKMRIHKGYDIYIDKWDVVAAATGTVAKIGHSQRAGLYVKLHHGAKLYTVYVHIRQALVKTGQTVKAGELIGRIDGAVGNASSPQLHFELKINDNSVDPLPLIEAFHQADSALLTKIIDYKQKLEIASERRDRIVKKFLASRRRQPIAEDYLE
jgi:hypothetical protein